jgi:hypothetical protein
MAHHLPGIQPFAGDPYDVGRFLREIEAQFEKDQKLFSDELNKIRHAAFYCTNDSDEWIADWYGKTSLMGLQADFNQFKRELHQGFCKFPEARNYFRICDEMQDLKQGRTQLKSYCSRYENSCSSAGVSKDHFVQYFLRGLRDEYRDKVREELCGKHWDPTKYEDVRKAAEPFEKELLKEHYAQRRSAAAAKRLTEAGR